jgi:hypothetical protein
VPIVSSPPYDTAGFILQQAIARSGDSGSPNGISGDLLNSAQPGVIQLLNGCYRDLQDRLISKGVETFNKYWEIDAIPPADTSNPSTAIYINYTGYFDGTNMQSDWFLPSDMIKPLELWERQTGNNFWVPMTMAADSISTRPPMPFFHEWDWQNDTLYLPVANQTNDMKIKGLCYAPDITDTNSPILISRCQTALAYLFLTEMAKQRGGLELAAAWKADADMWINAIVNRTARKEQYGSYFRLPFRGQWRIGRSSGG